MSSVDPVPSQYPGVSAYLAVHDAAAAIEFYTRAFGARERMRLPMPGGKIGHAELELAGGVLMLADEFEEMGHRGPLALGGTAVTLCFYVPDVDAAFDRALAAGGRAQRPVQDQFYGDRSGTLVDPFGHVWTLATHVENLTPEQIRARMPGGA